MGSDVLGGSWVGALSLLGAWLTPQLPPWVDILPSGAGVGSGLCSHRLRKEGQGRFSPTEWGSLVQGPRTPGNHSWDLRNRTRAGQAQAARFPGPWREGGGALLPPRLGLGRKTEPS